MLDLGMPLTVTELVPERSLLDTLTGQQNPPLLFPIALCRDSRHHPSLRSHQQPPGRERSTYCDGNGER